MDGVAPVGGAVEFNPFVVWFLLDAVDVPVAAGPAAPVRFACAGTEVFGDDVHVVVGNLVGTDVHGGGYRFNGDDGDGAGARALWR